MAHSSSISVDDFAERLRLWRARMNLTQAEAAKLLDINRSYLSQVEGKRHPGRVLRDRFQFIEKSSSLQHGILSHFSDNRNLRKVPVLSWAQAAQATDFERIRTAGDETVPTDVSDQHAFGVRLRGDSMEPRYSDGDIAILLPSIPATNGETVVANVKNHGALCKIMHVQLDKTRVKLSSYNPAYPPTEYHRDEFHWIYPVALVIREIRSERMAPGLTPPACSAP